MSIDPAAPTIHTRHAEFATDRALVARPSADLEIVIPAYNEAVRLPRTLGATVEFLAGQPWSSRIVVVDNGSADDTVGAVRAVLRVGADVPIDVIGCARPGKGAAVRRGLLSSTSRIVGFFDADLSTPVGTLAEAMRRLDAGATAVIGSRHAPGASFATRQPLTRRAGGAAFRALSQRSVSGVRDTQCGFKFFQRDAAVRALVRCRTTGYAFDVELLRRLQLDGGVISELPVRWTDDARSTFRPVRDGLASFGALLQIRQH